MLDHNPQYIDSLDFYTAIGVIARLREKVEERRLWDVWLVRFKRMNKENFESFSDFKDRINGPKVIQAYTKPKEEILAEVEKIRKGKVVGS